MDDTKIEIVERCLGPWYASLDNAPVAQHHKMMELLKIYEETELGQRSNAGSIETYNTFNAFFPKSTYQSLSAYFNSVYSGEYNIMMADPPQVWALSSDTSKGLQKHYPVTPYDLQARISAWPRALFSYINKTGRYDLLGSGLINLSFPSLVKYLQMGESPLPSGYASGIAARYGAEHFRLNLMPPQQELDKIPGDLSRGSWKKRYKAIIKFAKGREVGTIKGEVNAILNFGKFVKSQYRMLPKQIWGISVIVCFNGVGIHSNYKIPLREFYGDCTVLESYEIAEGALGQQLDESPYLAPNYDLYFYEVEMENGVKPLYTMRPGETGALIVSSSVLPRLRVGDIIRCMAPNRFVLIGKDKPLGKMKYNVFASGSPLTMQKDIW
jgi:hypothetical protein